MPWIDIVLALLKELNGLQLLFLGCAIVGGIVFMIRMVLALFFGGGDDFEPGMDVGDGDIIGDSDAAFSIISLQSIVGFLLIFGLAGLGCSVQLEMSSAASTLTAFAAGAVTMLIIAWITFTLRKLDQPGNISLQNAVGEVGTVYLTIPEGGGTGKASIRIQNRLRVYDAIAKDKSCLPTEERIKVVEVVGGTTLVVEKM